VPALREGVQGDAEQSAVMERPMRHLPLRETAIAVSTIVLLAVAYTASYLVIVQRDLEQGIYPECRLIATYRVGSEHSRLIFGPAYVIDQKLRPTFWSLDTLVGDMGFR
jgi:hypothetical protein